MQFRTMILAVCLFMASLSSPVSAAEAMKNLDALLEPVREEFEIPGLVAAVAKDGEIIASGAVGLRAIGYDIPATPEDRIHIGSDGKAMTSLLAAMLVEEGALRWDSTIGEVLGERVPGMNPKLAAVQLKQLLSHSSGIPTDTPEMLDIYFNDNAFNHNSSTLRLMALDAWKHNAPVIPDGSPFQYSNFGYMTAGAMIEEVTGKPWELLVRERIYEPLGLKSAGFGATATPGIIDAMVGHIANSDGVVEAQLWGNGADMPQLLAPAGTVHMSILDFARWASWVAGKTRRGPALVKPSTFDYLTTEKVQTPSRPNPPPGTPAEGGYAFGWSIEKFDWADKELVTHNGSNGMNLAKILIDFENDLAVVVAVNIGGKKADLAAGKVMGQLYTRFH
jgi:CubicO group peptidase (beta-lactamase class C family)